MFYRTELSKALALDPYSFVYSSVEALIVVGLVFLGHWLIKNSIVSVLKKCTQRAQNEMVRTLSRNRVMRNVTLALPFLLLYNCKDLFLNRNVVNFYEKGFYTACVIVLMMLFFSVMNVMTDAYSRDEKVVERFPVRPMAQIIKVLGFIIAMIVIAANFVDQTPVYILSGLGAISAVIMFIFKDSIQSLVAAFQITLHRSVKPGDWIEVPKYMVDGEVKEINLNLISIKNWDNTTTVIPTNCLLTESFKNWATMHKDGRRLKRQINIDVSSIRRLEQEDIDRLKRIRVLRSYLEDKEAEIKVINEEPTVGDLVEINGVSLTNIGTFRKYVELYLRQHPEILKDQLLVVRQLNNLSMGLPIELYCFTGKTKLAEFEEVSSDIFDHLYAVVELFGLKVFQSPSGTDLARMRLEPRSSRNLSRARP
ncbi:mechanosensitive ion channel family protein [Pseudomonas luteola]